MCLFYIYIYICISTVYICIYHVRSLLALYIWSKYLYVNERRQTSACFLVDPFFLIAALSDRVSESIWRSEWALKEPSSQLKIILKHPNGIVSPLQKQTHNSAEDKTLWKRNEWIRISLRKAEKMSQSWDRTVHILWVNGGLLVGKPQWFLGNANQRASTESGDKFMWNKL